jgi:HK97 family phage major capsid protein
METSQLEERSAAILVEIEADGADLDALEAEARGIKEELERRKAEEEKRAEIRSAVANSKTADVIEAPKKTEEIKEMTLEEVRNSQEYIDAFAKYIRTDSDKECRAIITDLIGFQEGDSGPVPTPTFVEGRIRQAWEKAGLMDLVRKTYMRGVVKVGFELSASDAAVHTENAEAAAAEELILGVVSLSPVSIKKYVLITDEAVDMGSREFIEYIYDEIAYKIAKLAENMLLTLISTAPTSTSTTDAPVTEIVDNGAGILSIVAQAISGLSDQAANPVIVMNKKTYAKFITARNNASYAVDPFEGLPVYFNSTLAETGLTDSSMWLVVGDFGEGAQANFPNGEEIRFKYDDISQAEADLVKIVGRMYVALGIVAPFAFTRVVNPNA